MSEGQTLVLKGIVFCFIHISDNHVSHLRHLFEEKKIFNAFQTIADRLTFTFDFLDCIRITSTMETKKVNTI